LRPLRGAEATRSTRHLPDVGNVRFDDASLIYVVQLSALGHVALSLLLAWRRKLKPGISGIVDRESNFIVTKIGIEILTNTFCGRISSKNGRLNCVVLSYHSVQSAWEQEEVG